MGGGGWKGKKIPLKQHSLKCILKYNKGLLFFFSSLLLLLSSFDITSSIVSCLVTLRIHWPALPVLSIIYKEVLLEKKGAEQNEKERTTTIKGLWKCLWNCKTPPKTIAVRNNSMHNLYNSLSRCPASCVILSLYLFFFFYIFLSLPGSVMFPLSPLTIFRTSPAFPFNLLFGRFLYLNYKAGGREKMQWQRRLTWILTSSLKVINTVFACLLSVLGVLIAGGWPCASRGTFPWMISVCANDKFCRRTRSEFCT